MFAHRPAMLIERLLLICGMVQLLGLTQAVKYKPMETAIPSCNQPGDQQAIIDTRVIDEIELLEMDTETGDLVEGINGLAASVSALNVSIQQQASLYRDLQNDVQSLQTAFSQLGVDDASTTDLMTMTDSPPTSDAPSTNPPQTTESPTTNPTTMNPTTSESLLTTEPPSTITDDPIPTTSGGVPPRGSLANPGSSCKDISQESPSGEYWIQNSKTNNSPIQVYCDMDRICNDLTGGWTRVANLDMTDPSQQCPDGFSQVNRTTPPLRTCGRPGSPGCVSITFSIPEPTYTHVYGRVIGYQFGGAIAFTVGLTIITNYVTGVSITHGDPRQHIWSFAAARDEVTTTTTNICPCTRPELTHTRTVPTYVGEDYFCDTGSTDAVVGSTFYDMDPLWDGQGCGGTSTCCSFNDPPWFCKPLPQPTADDIDLRLCHTAGTAFADIPLEIIELYVR